MKWEPVVCEKCESKKLLLQEHWTAFVEVEQTESGQIDPDSSATVEGDPTGKIHVECLRCGHQWRLPGYRELPALEDIP